MFIFLHVMSRLMDFPVFSGKWFGEENISIKKLSLCLIKHCTAKMYEGLDV
jgi:hypothetical protein